VFPRSESHKGKKNDRPGGATKKCKSRGEERWRLRGTGEGRKVFIAPTESSQRKTPSANSARHSPATMSSSPRKKKEKARPLRTSAGQKREDGKKARRRLALRRPKKLEAKTARSLRNGRRKKKEPAFRRQNGEKVKRSTPPSKEKERNGYDQSFTVPERKRKKSTPASYKKIKTYQRYCRFRRKKGLEDSTETFAGHIKKERERRTPPLIGTSSQLDKDSGWNTVSVSATGEKKKGY